MANIDSSYGTDDLADVRLHTANTHIQTTNSGATQQQQQDALTPNVVQDHATDKKCNNAIDTSHATVIASPSHGIEHSENNDIPQIVTAIHTSRSRDADQHAIISNKSDYTCTNHVTTSISELNNDQSLKQAVGHGHNHGTPRPHPKDDDELMRLDRLASSLDAISNSATNHNSTSSRIVSQQSEPTNTVDLLMNHYSNDIASDSNAIRSNHIELTEASKSYAPMASEQETNRTQPPPRLDHNSLDAECISIKSKIGVEFRRYALKRGDVQSFDSFYKKIESFHQLSAIPFVIFYTDPEDFLLPINNDDNLAKAISSAKQITLHNINQGSNNNNNNNNNNISHQSATFKRPFLKIFIEKKGIFLDYYNGNLTGKYKKNQHFKGLSNLILPSHHDQGMRPSIGMPEDFRQVSSIIDVHLVPDSCRRVRIVKHGSDRPLGFYIRDGTYKRMNAQGQLEMVTGIFISRLVPGGLAESTGLLAVNDEVLEVNGIQVTHGKTLDQVTDMMVANSSNLIITIRPGKTNNLN